MKEKSLPSYKELERALDKTALKLHPSQVHGLVCGILCGHANGRTAAWEELITGGAESGKTHQLLQEVYDISAKQLDEFLFEFELILPPQADELPHRAEALTLWCQGMLTGLKLAQVQIIDREPGDTTEAIEDLIEIAKMNYEEVVESEEDETAYVELVEYVRTAVTLIYQDAHEKKPSDKTPYSSSQLH
ncbi:MAG: UPF0149 family protein [Gammaproteobacteria bacterium]|nr:UPF0149 family protein [Gammaproteobacteria bacterium]